MKNLIRFFTKQHIFANIFTIMILIIGINSALSIKKDLLPDVDLAVVNITTEYPKASAEDVEINITNKIENQLKDVSGISEVSSLSIENVSSITVVLDESLEKSSVEETIQKIRDAVGNVKGLPSEISGLPVVSRRKSGDRPVIVVGISSENKTYNDLRTEAKLLERKLKTIGGVSKINKIGYRAREVKIEVDPQKIKLYQLDINELIYAVQNRNVRGTVGAMESFSCTQDVVTMSQFQKITDVGEVIVRSTVDGPVIRVKDFGIIKDDFEEERLYSRINGKKVIALNVFKNDGADIVNIVNSIKKLVNEEQKIVDDDISLEFSNDYSRYVSASYNVVLRNGITGFLLVILVLTLFLNFRTSIWVALGIPVSLLGSITILNLSGYSLNVISLSALILVIGIIVDDAIIISESIFKKYEEGKNSIDAAVEGLEDVIVPVLTTLATTVMAFSPLLFISGSFGKFIFVMPFVIIAALVISLFEGVIALPSHVSKSIKRNENKKSKLALIEKLNGKFLQIENFKKNVFSSLENLFAGFLTKLLKVRMFVAPLFILVLVLIFFQSSRSLEVISFPDEGAESMVINLEAAQGCGLQETESQILKIENLVKNLSKSEVQSFITTVGKKDNSLEKQNYAYISINLTPYSSRERNALVIADQLRQKIKTLDISGDVTFDIKGAGPSPTKPISIKVVGNDDQERKLAADTIYKYLSDSNGVFEMERDDISGKPQIRINFNYLQMALYGINVSDVLQELRIAYDGQIITSIQHRDEEINYRLISKNKSKNNDFLGDIYLSNKFGKIIQLKQIAKFSPATGLDGYKHYNNERVVTIEGNFDREIIDIKEVNENINKKFDSLNLKNTRLVIKGEIENRNSSNASFGRSFLIAILGIYLLLVLLFKSIKLPFLALSVVPFAIGGVLLTFLFHGQPLTFMGMMGIVGLTGVVVNDSIVLIDRLIKNDYSIMQPVERIAAVVKSTKDRFRAVLLTTITTAAGVLPLAYGLGGADFVNAPMALALGWGLIFGTVITLVFLPSVFLITINLKYKLKKK